MKIVTKSKVPRIAEFECLSRIHNSGDPFENAVCKKITETNFEKLELTCMKPKLNNQNTCYGDSGGKFQIDFNILISIIFNNDNN